MADSLPSASEPAGPTEAAAAPAPGARPAPPVDISGLSPDAVAEISQRWEISAKKWTGLKASLESARAGDRWPWACVYVTGSLARHEAFELSDLDLFIINMRRGQPKRIEEASLVTALDHARAEAGFEPFSRGGHYLEPHSFRDMQRDAGGPEDDVTNRFTARMLLLLNSMCLLNMAGYDRARSDILRLYWRDCPDENRPYVPLFLLNDIRRHWLTMCLNFEQKTPPQRVGMYDSRSDGKRRVGNLKLRATRLLDCYTPILGLLHVSDTNGVTRVDAMRVFNETPLERLRDIAADSSGEASELAIHIIEFYSAYLALMRQTEDVLQLQFGDDSVWSEAKSRATVIGDDVARLMEVIGSGKKLYRVVVV